MLTVMDIHYNCMDSYKNSMTAFKGQWFITDLYPKSLSGKKIEKNNWGSWTNFGIEVPEWLYLEYIPLSLNISSQKLMKKNLKQTQVYSAYTYYVMGNVEDYSEDPIPLKIKVLLKSITGFTFLSRKTQ